MPIKTPEQVKKERDLFLAPAVKELEDRVNEVLSKGERRVYLDEENAEVIVEVKRRAEAAGWTVGEQKSSGNGRDSAYHYLQFAEKIIPFVGIRN